MTQLTHMNPRSSAISLYWDLQIWQSGGEMASRLPENRNKHGVSCLEAWLNSVQPLMLNSAWNPSALFPFVWMYFWSASLLLRDQLTRLVADENTLTLEGQLCWSCGAVGVWGGGRCLGRSRPASSHRYTVCFENSLSCFTRDHSWKTDTGENTISRWRSW